MRALSETFMRDLLDGGLLHPILARVKKDQTLMLAIRNGYINIYYRGGNILRVKERSQGCYETYFDANYKRAGQSIPDFPAQITDQAGAITCVALFPEYKNVMDEYFSVHEKAEREFQQLVARENNCSSISNETEYFISDIEFADEVGRFDILAIRWLANERKDGANCRPVFIEMKYGDGALSGSAGLIKHLKDFEALFLSGDRYANLLDSMKNQFNQLDQLGLLNFNKGKSDAKVKFSDKVKPEVIFILANHNPRSTKLKTILDKPEIDAYGQSPHFDLKFHVASFSGYGLHAKCMCNLYEFRKLL